MIALYARGVNGGLGQHVDVSMQEAVANAMDNAQMWWDIARVNLAGPGLRRNTQDYPTLDYLFEANDGWVAAQHAGGLMGPTSEAIIDWLAETGEDGGLASAEWRARLAVLAPLEDEERIAVNSVMAAFCRTRSKEELVAGAQARMAGWAPVYTPRELVDSAHLAARNYWIAVHHEDLGQTFLYPGAPARFSETPWMQRGRAPHLGEHNEAIYGDLLGLDEAERRRLRLKMVI
jgi:crotonobetainyl-CoA:carnitine CoA-transferase CaiB-like acyl-CoA transferase